MAENSVATTSALLSPSTIAQILRTCSSRGRPSLAIKVGLVVTPSTMPQEAPFFNSSRLAVSRKNFTPLPSRVLTGIIASHSFRIVRSVFENLLHRDVWLPDERARFRKGNRHAPSAGLRAGGNARGGPPGPLQHL